jgi:hypothetical protein
MSQAQTILNTITTCYSMIIGVKLLEAINWGVMPRTPYYLRKRIIYLQYELMKKTLEYNEEILRP